MIKSKSDTNLYCNFNQRNSMPKSIPYSVVKKSEKIIPPSFRLDPSSSSSHQLTDPSLLESTDDFTRMLNQHRLVSAYDARETRSPAKVDQLMQTISSSLASNELRHRQSVKSSCPIESNDILKTYLKSNISILTENDTYFFKTLIL